jgi:Arc/MetJ family transcription regulator
MSCMGFLRRAGCPRTSRPSEVELACAGPARTPSHGSRWPEKPYALADRGSGTRQAELARECGVFVRILASQGDAPVRVEVRFPIRSMRRSPHPAARLRIPPLPEYTVHMKRTCLVLDEALLEEATRISGETTYSAAVQRALRDFVRRAKARQLIELRGSGSWEGSLSEMREGRRPRPKRGS